MDFGPLPLPCSGGGLASFAESGEGQSAAFPLWPLTGEEELLWQSGARPPVFGGDSDGDGLADADEEVLLLDAFDPEDGQADADGDGFDAAWEWYIGSDPTVPWSPAGFHGQSALGSPQVASSFVPAVPTLVNGDFSEHGLLGNHHSYYPNNGFDYGYVPAGGVAGWEAVEGSEIEIWSDGDGRTGVVELEARGGHSGLRQQISFTEAGTYLIQWDQCGRKDFLPYDDLTPEDSAFSVIVAQKNGQGLPDPAATYGSRMQESVVQEWTTTGLLLTIPPAAIRSGAEIWLFFQPATNSTQGALVDNVSVHRVLVTEEEPNSGFDRTPIPTAAVNENSPAIMVPVDGENFCLIQVHPELNEDFLATLELAVEDEDLAVIGGTAPTLAGGQPETLILEGTGEGHTEVELRHSHDEQTIQSMPLLQVDGKEVRQLPLTIYQIHDPAHGDAWQAPTLEQVTDILEATWGRQANVVFDLDQVEVEFVQVAYDLIPDGFLDTEPEDDNSPIPNPEVAAVMGSLAYPSGTKALVFCNTIDNGAGNTVFDNEIAFVSLSPQVGVPPEDFEETLYIAAHEAGHLLGLKHEDSQPPTLSDGQDNEGNPLDALLYDQQQNLMYWSVQASHPRRIVSEDWNLVNSATPAPEEG